MTKQTRTLVLLLCDLHDEDVEAEETVSFSANGTAYEMELCAEHLAEFNEAMEAWAERARPATTRRRRSAASPGSDAPSSGRAPAREEVDRSAAREWARANGYEVSDRGRVAQEVLDAFVAAQAEAG
ncbi:MAG: histone-like nucleoid-structuring protein Lsr2 [Acidimicrobiales bacterium]